MRKLDRRSQEGIQESHGSLRDLRTRLLARLEELAEEDDDHEGEGDQESYGDLRDFRTLMLTALGGLVEEDDDHEGEGPYVFRFQMSTS